MPKPTVLIAIKGLGIGGAERLVADGAAHWDRDAFDYHVAYALPWKNDLVGPLTGHGVPVHLVGGPRGLSLATLSRLRAVIERTATRLVHAHLPSMGVLARLASPVPVVYTEHNLVGSYGVISRWANRLTYARNDSVITVSQEVARSIEGYPGPSPIIVPNGVGGAVTAGDATRARRELGLGHESRLVVHVGNIRPHKGHSTLIEAAVRLKALGVQVSIVSIGGEKHPGDLDRVRRQAERAGVSGYIRFLGRRADALGFIAAADIFVNASDFEGMPIAVMEAMAVGTPIVATAVGGVPELIKNGVNGVLVDSGDPESLAEAISDLLEHPEQAREYANAAQSLIEEAYGLERMVRSHEDVYRAVLGA